MEQIIVTLLHPVQKTYSSIGHVVFTWLEMFSHVFRRHCSPVFAGSVCHVESSLPALLTRPAQLNHVCALGWPGQPFPCSSPASEVAGMTASVLAGEPRRQSWGARAEVSLWQRRRRLGKAWEKRMQSSQATPTDNSLKWEEKEETQGETELPLLLLGCFVFEVLIPV